VTGRHLFKKKVTIEYPEQKKLPSDRFRGMFRLDEERCIKCTLCAIECPIDIIYIDWHNEKNEAGKSEKVLDRFDVDLKRCMFCQLCEEACPTGAQVDLADDEDLRDGGIRPQRLAVPGHPQADRLAGGGERQALHGGRAGMSGGR
jgi:formate hydrogenlyase subunit 6/NADH:ubiquinone oxidoreductase subunit I